MSCLVLSSSLLSWHDKLCDIYSKQCEVLVHVNVTLCLSYLLHAMYCLLHFHVFIHMHIASHLGTLDAPMKDVMMESNQKAVLVDLS